MFWGFLYLCILGGAIFGDDWEVKKFLWFLVFTVPIVAFFANAPF